ncbi:hypothetical protein BD310DRAFT_913091 [Dichomitus squalens]|uniref:Uncharacterized protein n=1 Tax=Dichomitus squalens TaxID=114155 RepID=A0A4Q9QD69_9APHY|nr:hypothetical protein BD310DRAFT_913091 [Dichomitus squalens]
MARATRSTTTHENDKPDTSPPASRKGASKKRKRTSNPDNDDSLPTKHARTDSTEDTSPDVLNRGQERKQGELPSSGDVPIQSSDAANILDVLESVDTQGLLDRVFPLSTDPGEPTSGPSSSSSTTTMLSLRSLLKNSALYPLKTLRAAVKQLHPISSHPRFRPSETAAQQLRFCNLATSLLDQASQNNAPVPLDVETIITDVEVQSEAPSPASTHAPSAGVRPHKYALVQRLPTGDWWTSASSDAPTADGASKDLKSLHTAKAELVSIFPSTSGTQLAHKGTLGDYVVKRAPGVPPLKPPQARRVSCGKFLDYGPYASFAPSFDQEGVEVGRVAMGEVIFYQQMKRRLRSLAKGKRRAFLGLAEPRAGDVVEDGSTSNSPPTAGPSTKDDDLSKDLESLLSPEEVRNIKSALRSLEMEQAVDELLQRNAKALERLEELQLERLRSQGGGSSVVEVGSEEWDIAQGITDSLAILASLRPRPSNGDPEHAPLIPPASVLHKLQRTLPLAATEGWYGTLPEGRTTAYRDDTTVHVRASSVASKTTPAPATPAPKATTAAAPPYTPYPYTGTYQSQYRGYGTYPPPTQSSSYYPSLAYNALASQTAAGTHYPNAQYAATAQTQYYGSWYTSSGRSTPQPAPAATSYASYYAGAAAQQPQAQRAVANTVVSSTKQPVPAYQPPPWTGATAAPATGYAPPLPPHMRAAVGAASAPGTPSPTTPTAAPQYGAYYGGYAAPR